MRLITGIQLTSSVSTNRKRQITYVLRCTKRNWLCEIKLRMVIDLIYQDGLAAKSESTKIAVAQAETIARAIRFAKIAQARSVKTKMRGGPLIQSD